MFLFAHMIIPKKRNKKETTKRSFEVFRIMLREIEEKKVDN